jgi:hypothetical protein
LSQHPSSPRLGEAGPVRRSWHACLRVVTSGHDDIVDVAVVEGALRRGGDAVVTSNESDIRKIAGPDAKRLRIELV